MHCSRRAKILSNVLTPSSLARGLPRAPFLFLYPPWFSTTNKKPSSASAAIFADHNGSNYGDSEFTVIGKAGKGEQEQGDGPELPTKSAQETEEVPTQLDSTWPSKSDTTNAYDQDYFSGRRNPSKSASRRRHGLERRKSTAEAISSFKTLREAMSRQPGTEERPESFQLGPPQVRLMKKKVDEHTEQHEKKSVFNSLMKEKGPWSGDWRFSLRLLRQHSEADHSPALYSAAYIRDHIQYRQVPAYDIPPPPVWTKENLVTYLYELTHSKVSRQMQRHLYKDSPPHVLAVRNVLFSIFDDPAMTEFLSPAAFDIALLFFYIHNTIRDSRILLNRMLETDVPVQTSTFNIMLRGAAEHNDLHNFTSLLMSMTEMGIKPNENTWVAFVSVVESKVVKYAIVKAMRERGFLQRPDTLQAIVIELLPMEAVAHILSGMDLIVLLEQFDSKYGPNWFSTYAANLLCKALGEHGRFQDIVNLLGVVVQRGCKPDRITLITLLSLCTKLLDINLALRFLVLFRSRYNIHPNEDAFHLLFMIAWRKKKYNACRAIWRVACVNAFVSFRMQELVMRSLLRNTPMSTQSKHHIWMKEAGKVIIGVDFGAPGPLQPPPKSGREENPGHWDIMKDLMTWAPPEERPRRLELAKQQLAADLDACNRCRFDGDFLALLAEALKRDAHWEEGDRWRMPIAMKIHRALWTNIVPK